MGHMGNLKSSSSMGIERWQVAGGLIAVLAYFALSLVFAYWPDLVPPTSIAVAATFGPPALLVWHANGLYWACTGALFVLLVVGGFSMRIAPAAACLAAVLWLGTGASPADLSI